MYNVHYMYESAYTVHLHVHVLLFFSNFCYMITECSQRLPLVAESEAAGRLVLPHYESKYNVHIYIHVYIYIYIEREREREREREISRRRNRSLASYMYTHTHITGLWV